VASISMPESSRLRMKKVDINELERALQRIVRN
jgi:hypothetical protein